MKKLIYLFALTAFGIGCGAPNEQGIALLGAVPLAINTSGDSDTCNRATLQQLRGTLDISASSTYLMSFDVASQLESSTTTVGGQAVDADTESTFVARTLEITYRSTPALTFESGTQSIYFILEAGSSGDAYFSADLISNSAAATLLAGVAPGTSVELEATVRVLGATLGGTSMASNSAMFPITVSNSGFTGCGAGTQVPNGPCGTPGGQDGTTPACCSDPAFSASSFCT